MIILIFIYLSMRYFTVEFELELSHLCVCVCVCKFVRAELTRFNSYIMTKFEKLTENTEKLLRCM